MSGSRATRRKTLKDAPPTNVTHPRYEAGEEYDESNESLTDDDSEIMEDDSLDSGLASGTDNDEASFEEDVVLENASPSRRRPKQGSKTNGASGAPFSPGASRKSKTNATIAKEGRNATNVRVDRGEVPISGKQMSTGMGFITAAVVVGLVIMLCAAVVLRTPNVSSQCTNGLARPIKELESEFAKLGDFPPSFDPREFVSFFSHRSVGRPTVLHVVSNSTILPKVMVDWIHKQQPCAGKLRLEANLGDFMKQIGEKAIQFEDAHVDPESCRVVATVLLENSKFDKTNRDWLEAVLDDTRPHAITRTGQISTDDWCLLLLDHWTGEKAKILKDWDTIPWEDVEANIRNITAPLWTGRFYQRIGGGFYV